MAKLNKAWQAAADELKALIPDAAGQSQAESGLQHMYDLAAAETDPKVRTVALVRGFADNCNALAAHAAKQPEVTAQDVAQMSRGLLAHTLKHFNTIVSSGLHGHQKD